MLQDSQVLGNDHNKPHSLMSDPISTMYFHNMSCDLLNKILFKPKTATTEENAIPVLGGSTISSRFHYISSTRCRGLVCDMLL